MKNRILKLLCTLIAIAMLLSTAACGSGTNPTQGTSGASPSIAGGKEPVTLSLYVADYWCSSYIDPSWTDPVAKELTKRTGVTLKVIVPASDDSDGELNKLIASNDLADMIYMTWGSSKDALPKGGYVKPLDELIEKYGPNIKKNLGGSFPAWINRSDGKIYNIGFWYFNKVVRPALNLQVTTLQMRYDILKEIGYAKLDRSKEGSMNSFITLQEYYTLLDQVKAKHPDITAALVNPGDAFSILLRGTGRQVHNNYLWENSQATNFVFSADAPWAMKEVNNIFQKGYAKVDHSTTTDESRKALLADGKVFSTLGYASLISDIQGTLSKDNDERRFCFFYLRKDGNVDNIYINGASGDAGSGIHINAGLDEEKTRRAMEFLDYCSSDEGSLLVNAGIEGKDYFKDETTGWYKPEEKMFAGYRVWDANVLKERGVGGWLNILPNLAGVNAEGHCFDVNAEYAFTQDPWVIYNNSDWEHFSYSGIGSPYNSLDSDLQAEAADAESKIEAYRKDRLDNIMMQKDPGVIDKEIEKLRAQMKSDGIDALQKAKTDNWLEIAKRKGVSPERINQTPAQGK